MLYAKWIANQALSVVKPRTLQVHLVNLVNGTETTINLGLVPLCLSVSPDGAHAAVGRDGWISHVNLSLGYVSKLRRLSGF